MKFEVEGHIIGLRQIFRWSVKGFLWKPEILQIRSNLRCLRRMGGLMHRSVWSVAGRAHQRYNLTCKISPGRWRGVGIGSP